MQQVSADVFDMQKEENQKTNKYKQHSQFQVDCPQSLFLWACQNAYFLV